MVGGVARPDRDEGPAAGRRDPSLRRELEGVVQQIEKDLLEAARIADDQLERGVRLESEIEPTGGARLEETAESDLPPAFGHWNSQFRRFRRWAEAGVFEILFNAMSDDPDFEYALIDGTIVSVHQKATGAKGGLKLRPSGARAVG